MRIFFIFFNHILTNLNFCSDVSLYIQFQHPSMKQLFRLIFALALIYNLSAQQALFVNYPTFEDYIKIFGKSYSGTQYQTRKTIYDNRVATFNAISAYVPGTNKFTDWKDQQLLKIKNLKTLGAPSGKVPPNPSPNNLVSLSWKGNKKITPVKDQGTCGSSWAFAATAYSQSKLLIDNRYNSIDLADQKIFQCTKQSNCDGGYIQYAMDSAVDGIPYGTLFAYKPDFSYLLICNVPSFSPGGSVENYYNLNDSQLITLLQERPLVISVSSNGWENYKSGVFQCVSTDKVNHAALLVGYDSTSWLIKNSWGSNWGQQGYIRVSRTAGLNCKIGASAHRTFEWQLFSAIILVFLVCLSLA